MQAESRHSSQARGGDRGPHGSSCGHRGSSQVSHWARPSGKPTLTSVRSPVSTWEVRIWKVGLPTRLLNFYLCCYILQFSKILSYSLT